MKKSRNTEAKSKIQDLINSSPKALSSSEIQHALNGLCNRVTIYRVLERLIDEDVIHKIVNTDGVIKYASCNACTTKHTHNHVHFSCQKCKSVTCLEDVKPKFVLPENYVVSEMHFTLSGLCAQCAT